VAEESVCRQYAAQRVGLVPPQVAEPSVLSSAAADAGYGTAGLLQWRYDIAYQQCMYAKGNQVPGFPVPAPSSDGLFHPDRCGVAPCRPSGRPGLGDHDQTCPRSPSLLYRADGQAHGGPCGHRDRGSSHRTPGTLHGLIAGCRVSGTHPLSEADTGLQAVTMSVDHPQRAVMAWQGSDVPPALISRFPTHKTQWW
jgi:hypothetical protein